MAMTVECVFILVRYPIDAASFNCRGGCSMGNSDRPVLSQIPPTCVNFGAIATRRTSHGHCWEWSTSCFDCRLPTTPFLFGQKWDALIGQQTSGETSNTPLLWNVVIQGQVCGMRPCPWYQRLDCSSEGGLVMQLFGADSGAYVNTGNGRERERNTAYASNNLARGWGGPMLPACGN